MNVIKFSPLKGCSPDHMDNAGARNWIGSRLVPETYTILGHIGTLWVGSRHHPSDGYWILGGEELFQGRAVLALDNRWPDDLRHSASIVVNGATVAMEEAITVVPPELGRDADTLRIRMLEASRVTTPEGLRGLAIAQAGFRREIQALNKRIRSCT